MLKVFIAASAPNGVLIARRQRARRSALQTECGQKLSQNFDVIACKLSCHKRIRAELVQIVNGAHTLYDADRPNFLGQPKLINPSAQNPLQIFLGNRTNRSFVFPHETPTLRLFYRQNLSEYLIFSTISGRLSSWAWLKNHRTPHAMAP